MKDQNHVKSFYPIKFSLYLLYQFGYALICLMHPAFSIVLAIDLEYACRHKVYGSGLIEFIAVMLDHKKDEALDLEMPTPVSILLLIQS